MTLLGKDFSWQVREIFYSKLKINIYVSTSRLGKHDAHILLQNEPEVYSRNVYEVVLGSDLNRMSVLRSSCHGPCIDDLETPGILNETEYRSFWITWNTSLAIGQGTKIDISNIILFTRMDFPIKSMRISYGWGSDGFFRFHDKLDFVTSTLTTTSTTTETFYSRSTHKGKTDVFLPDRGTTISRKDEDKPSVLTVALATSTGFCFVILLSTILWVCYLWNKRKSTGMETHSQPNPVGGEHYEGLRGREQESVYQNEEQYASVSV
ncbi:uncharacterized protein LOC128205947 isoform X3 [Mya arenaria]|uniref:uncharacterized protein LOC128205947 isoform X3 n=1 Tax=Mya arenaria TaxID=6604 RepID=UPI0022E4EC12|nr:uncharacterized protein LOC128205947 isoform X3 [Mya arenaria]